jgi:hypothetical protein
MIRIACTTLLLLLGPAAVAAGATQQTPLSTIQGTVLAVHPPTGSLDVVTGVGMALRVVRLTAAPALRSAIGGARAPMDAIRRGDVVRVWSHREGKRLVADRIQRMGRP